LLPVGSNGVIDLGSAPLVITYDVSIKSVKGVLTIGRRRRTIRASPRVRDRHDAMPASASCIVRADPHRRDDALTGWAVLFNNGENVTIDSCVVDLCNNTSLVNAFAILNTMKWVDDRHVHHVRQSPRRR